MENKRLQQYYIRLWLVEVVPNLNGDYDVGL